MTHDEARVAIATIKRVAEVLETRLRPDGTVLGRRGYYIDLAVIERAVADLRAYKKEVTF